MVAEEGLLCLDQMVEEKAQTVNMILLYIFTSLLFMCYGIVIICYDVAAKLFFVCFLSV